MFHFDAVMLSGYLKQTGQNKLNYLVQSKEFATPKLRVTPRVDESNCPQRGVFFIKLDEAICESDS